MNLNIKLDEGAYLPQYAHPGMDAGMDLTAIGQIEYKDGIFSYETGVHIELPKGYAGFILPRSSIYKTKLILCNSCGLIDPGYTGSISVKFYGEKGKCNPYAVGDRIAQLVVVPFEIITWSIVDKFNQSERGNGGFGSTNK